MNTEIMLPVVANLPPITFTQAALEAKEKALESSALVARVSNAAENDSAVIAQKELARVIREVERARKEVKDPVIDIGRRIDDAAKAFVVELKGEELRIAKLVGDFQALEEAKRKAAEEAARLERERIERERWEAERKAAEAARIEAARIEQERQKALAEAKSHAELEKAQQEAAEAQKRLSEQQARLAEEAEARAKAQAAAIVAPTPVRAEGQTVRTEWDFEVTDIWALARAHPACVSIEARRSEVKAMLAAGVKVAGVRAWQQTKASVRTGRERVIEV